MQKLSYPLPAPARAHCAEQVLAWSYIKKTVLAIKPMAKPPASAASQSWPAMRSNQGTRRQSGWARRATVGTCNALNRVVDVHQRVNPAFAPDAHQPARHSVRWRGGQPPVSAAICAHGSDASRRSGEHPPQRHGVDPARHRSPGHLADQLVRRTQGQRRAA